MSDNKYLSGELINIELEFYQATNSLVSEIVNHGACNVPLIELRCAEILTLRHKLELFLIIQSELNHCHISSLITYWDSLFLEIKSVVRHNDRNTSWLSSQFKSFEE